MSTPAFGADRVAGQPAPRVLALEGARLAGVEFAGGAGRTTLLRFDHGRLEVLGNSALVSRDRVHPSGDRAWGDGLLALVGVRVAHVILDLGHRLELLFENGVSLGVNLEPNGHAGPESAAYFDEKWNYEPY